MSPREGSPIRLTRSQVVGPSSAPRTAADSTTPIQAGGWLEDKLRIAIGKGINVSGKLSFAEPVRIEGTFRGELSSVSLIVVAEEARVEGRVRAQRLVVLGELNGDIYDAGQVVFGPTARVQANVETGSLAIYEGALFEGDVSMPNRAAGQTSADSRIES